MSDIKDYAPRLDRILSHTYLGRWPTQEDTALAIAEVKALRDELDTLRAENERLREALTFVAETLDFGSASKERFSNLINLRACVTKARAALKGGAE